MVQLLFWVGFLQIPVDAMLIKRCDNMGKVTYGHLGAEGNIDQPQYIVAVSAHQVLGILPQAMLCRCSSEGEYSFKGKEHGVEPSQLQITDQIWRPGPFFSVSF